jgi:hypothetical protein
MIVLANWKLYFNFIIIVILSNKLKYMKCYFVHLFLLSFPAHYYTLLLKRKSLIDSASNPNGWSYINTDYFTKVFIDVVIAFFEFIEFYSVFWFLVPWFPTNRQSNLKHLNKSHLFLNNSSNLVLTNRENHLTIKHNLYLNVC